MADTEIADPQLKEGWQSQVSSTMKRFIPFNLDELQWSQVVMPADGGASGNLPETLRGNVDFHEYYEQGMWTSFVDAGAFNILGIKMAPNFTIQRHHHNIHQLVLVHSGEVYQGARKYVPGDGYFTRAGHTYSVTAGPEGCVIFEVRGEPIGNLETVWDEDDPKKWVHGRRPGGPAATLVDESGSSE